MKLAAVLPAAAAIALALAACGSTSSTQTTAQVLSSSATATARVSTSPSSSPSAAQPAAKAPPPSVPRRSRIDGFVNVAQATYHQEARGAKLSRQLRRIAGDRVLVDALSRGDLAGAQAEADAQLRSPINHSAHVTRISVVRGSQVLVNATVNSDGVFVVAPGSRVLRLHGRPATLLVSLQDVTGFVKLVHRRTGVDVLARGGSGQVRTSLRAAAAVRLPASGHVTIAGRGYFVRSFHEISWGNEPRGNEPLAVWILEGS